MKRIVLLLGAGASIEYGVPGTIPMTALLEKAVLSDSFMHWQGAQEAYLTIRDVLGQHLDSPDNVNFEHIYHCIHELNHYKPITSNAVNEYRFLLQPFVEMKHSFKDLALYALERKIISELFKIVSASCKTPNYPLSSLSDFISHLSSKAALRIYTTNYDDFPVQACPSLATGFAEGNPTKFDSDGFSSLWDRSGIFHLHGSIHFGFPRSDRSGFEIGELGWYSNPAEALKNHEFNGGADRRMDGSTVTRSPVITGLDKLSRIQANPMKHYYAALPKDLMSCDLIIVAGSGLADLHLNSWIQEARQRNPKVPLLMIDYWKEGFDAQMDHSRRSLDMVHVLRIEAFEPHLHKKLKKDGAWTISPQSRSAIWDAGFKAFLSDYSSMNQVLRAI